jgi:hypothetical protein
MGGELLKPGIKVCKRTIQKYLPEIRALFSSSQTWVTFVKDQARDIVACDFSIAEDGLFRLGYLFGVMELNMRRMVHAPVTHSPTDEWTAHQ